MSKIHIVFGPQGAGKSTYSKKLAIDANAVHLSIDAWMWAMYGADLPKTMNLKWIMERVERCEKQIWATAKQIGRCGGDVILDLGFTKLAKRKQFKALATEQNMQIQVHYVTAPHATRKARVLNRNIEKGSTFSFEVTPGMFDFMEGELHSPTEEELANAIIVDTGTKS